MKFKNSPILILSGLFLIQKAEAVTIEPAGKAIAGILGTTKATKKTLQIGGNMVTAFYSKDENGKTNRIVFLEKGVYEPNCSHTWAVGINAQDGTVSEVRVLELSCHHAFPIKSASFLDQYKGKGPTDLKKLDSEIVPIAKATGSCKLTTDAVKKSITHFEQFKGQI